VTSAAGLSEPEMDALLTAVHRGDLSVSPGGARGAAAVVSYNFRRPSRLSKDHVRGLQVLHDDFAKVASASLSGMLRTMVDLELEAVEQIAYSEYIAAMATPTCAFVFNMEPLKGGAVFDLSPQIAFTMIDRLLGGTGLGVPAGRDLTEIERAVIERVGVRVVADLGQAWQQVAALVVRVLNLETNPQFIQATSTNEVILVTSFRLKIGDAVGGMTLAYPYLLLESIIDRLSRQRWIPTGTSGPRPEARAFLLRELSQSPLTLRAFLGRTRLTVGDLLRLRPGQVVPLEARREHPVRVEIDNVPKFVGRAGTHRTRLAVEILAAVDEGNPDP